MNATPEGNPAAELRKLLAAPGLVRAPGIFDGLGAHLVRDAGFDIEKTALGTQTEGGTDISYTWILARKVSAPA